MHWNCLPIDVTSMAWEVTVAPLFTRSLLRGRRLVSLSVTAEVALGDRRNVESPCSVPLSPRTGEGALAGGRGGASMELARSGLKAGSFLDDVVSLCSPTSPTGSSPTTFGVSMGAP